MPALAVPLLSILAAFSLASASKIDFPLPHWVDPPENARISKEFCARVRARTREAVRTHEVEFVAEPRANEPFALYRVPPQWPPDFHPMLGKEGFAVVEFTVDADGRTADLQVVEASEKEFGKEAVRAVAKWRYCPVFRNGVPVETKGMQFRVEFKLEAGERQQTGQWHPLIL